MDKYLLYKEIESLCEEVTGIDYNYSLQLDKGFELISNYKKEGGCQVDAYDILYPLHLIYMVHEEDEQKMNLIDDLLDCVCGYIGNVKYRIWKEPLNK